jgi:hypothetical protein
VNIFTAIALYFAPNRERERWTAVQAAWHATAGEAGVVFDDERDDVWPLTRRTFTVGHVPVSMGIAWSTTFLEADDKMPLRSLTCHVGLAASPTHRRGFERVTTGDLAFDRDLYVQANDLDAARLLLGERLRGALRVAPAPFEHTYDHGRVRVAWPATALAAHELRAALDLLIASVARESSLPYRGA